MVTSYASEHLPQLGMWAFRQNHASCDAVSTTTGSGKASTPANDARSNGTSLSSDRSMLRCECAHTDCGRARRIHMGMQLTEMKRHGSQSASRAAQSICDLR